MRTHAWAFLLALLFLAGMVQAESLSGEARIELPGKLTTISASQSLPVVALSAPTGGPVEAGALVVELDLAKLNRELNSRQKELNEVQAERRYRASNKEVARKSSARLFDGPPDPMETNLEMRESDALRDLLDVQSKLSTAQIRAPADGYVVEHFLVPGGDAKRRKPAFRFAELAETRVTVEVKSSAGSAFSPGARVRVASADEPALAFGARVDSLVITSEGGALYTLVPLELPFLRLATPTRVNLGAAN